jgi:hypothetical protein
VKAVVVPSPRLLEEECAKLIDLAESSEWLDWMRRELLAGGVDLPSEETSVLFAARSIYFARRVLSLCKRRPPDGVLTLAIQASILHQCWARQRKLRESAIVYARPSGELRTNRGTKFIRRLDCENLVEASDGQQYLVRFPRSDSDTALASEIIGIELARLMGLPVPEVSVILVTCDLAREIGVVSRGWPRYVSKGSIFSCLGLQTVENLETGCHNHRLSGRSAKYFIGALVFDILVLNLIHEEPVLHMVDQHAEPVFLYRSCCLMNANWPQFLRAGYKERATIPFPLSLQITSSAQLEAWVLRARNVDLNEIWKLVFNMPSVWYGGHRISVTSVLRKLERRIENLRDSIDHLVREGYFPNVRDPERETRLGEN